MKNNQIEKILTPANEKACPADSLMYDFRKKLKNSVSNYANHIEISNSSIKYWKEHADDIIENNDNIIFGWREIPEEQLPPLKIKVKKNEKGYTLMYLKEYGNDKLLMQGKQRKGKNKHGIILLEKEIEEGRSL